MPRKVTVYISAPPGDSLEKSRNWFREYVKVKARLYLLMYDHLKFLLVKSQFLLQVLLIMK